METQDPLFKEAPPLPAEDARLVDLFRQLSPADARLIDLYTRLGTPADRLPYSEEFERMYQALQQAGDRRDRREVYLRLLNLRKAGRLPRLDAA